MDPVNVLNLLTIAIAIGAAIVAVLALRWQRRALTLLAEESGSYAKILRNGVRPLLDDLAEQIPADAWTPELRARLDWTRAELSYQTALHIARAERDQALAGRIAADRSAALAAHQGGTS